MSDKKPVGSIGWLDLTVENAGDVRDFYQGVVGWESDALSMGDYDDYVMKQPADGEATGGVCHARGGNAGIPPVWMPYFVVADLDASLKHCRENGGELIHGPKEMGADRYCIIRDPAGAACALYQYG